MAAKVTHNTERPLALLVDNDRDTLDLYAHYFNLNSWRIEDATDGASALVKAVQLHPDAIVTETWLPVVDGLRLIRILKADPDTASIPIVVVTADARAEEREDARVAGSDAVIVKPCAPEELIAIVERTRERSRAIRSQARTTLEHAERALTRAVDVQVHAIRVARRWSAKSVKTTDPALRAPELHCPTCSVPLMYDFSYVGGVRTHQEQWDYLHCPGGCGTFQYRHRTRRLRMTGS